MGSDIIYYHILYVYLILPTIFPRSILCLASSPCAPLLHSLLLWRKKDVAGVSSVHVNSSAAGVMNASISEEPMNTIPISSPGTASLPPNLPSAQSSCSDHVGEDIFHLNLTTTQMQRIEDIFHSKALLSSSFQSQALRSNWSVNRHQIYRYFAATHWNDLYNGKPVLTAVLDTVRWRDEFGINHIDIKCIKGLIERGVAMVNGVDKHGRAIL